MWKLAWGLGLSLCAAACADDASAPGDNAPDAGGPAHAQRGAVDAGEAAAPDLQPMAAAGSGGAGRPASRGSKPTDVPPTAAGGAAPTPDTDAGGPEDGPEILTQRYDNARTGANLHETRLRPENVKDLQLLGSWRIDSEVYAQVLVASGVEIAGARRAVAVVATLNDTLYAFDADAAPADAFLWQVGAKGELGTPAYCARNIGGPNGILSTPVIDKARERVYVVARDCDPSFPPEMPVCKQRLFQIDLKTGAVQRSLAIEGEVAFAANGGMRRVRFEPSAHWNRPGLLLRGDDLVIAFGSGPAGNQHEEDFVYHGWVFRYDVAHLDAAPDVYCTTPRGRGGSVWQSGAAPAADDDAIFVTGANGIQSDSQVHPPGEWPTVPTGQEDSVVRLPHGMPFPTPADKVEQYWDDRSYIAAGNVFQHMESGDNGFGSSGPMLIPDTHALLVGTKAGLTYLLDRDSMRPLQEPLSPFTDQPLQPGHSLYLHSWWGIPMTTQAFVYFRPGGGRYGYAYAWAYNDRLRQLRYDYDSGQLQLTATADVPDVLGGGNLVLSADGLAAQSGVLWAVSRAGLGTHDGTGTLWAFDPQSLAVLWQTATPAFAKFTPPTVVRGRVLVPSTSPDTAATQQILVYGLR